MDETKSKKLADAVNRVAEKNGGSQAMIVKDDRGELEVFEVPQGYEGMIGKSSPDEVAKDVSSGKYEFAPIIVKLVQGMYLTGVLEGSGGVVELERIDRDPHTKEIKVIVTEVNTWVIRDPKTGLRLSFLSAKQLETKLPPFVGGLVKIYVGPMLESSKGTRYRDFRVGGEKLDKPRTFALLAPPVKLEVANDETSAS
jgi:hypothetical protein